MRAHEEAYKRQTASRSDPDLVQSDEASQNANVRFLEGVCNSAATGCQCVLISLHTKLAISVQQA
jgi:hypothetical protein